MRSAGLQFRHLDHYLLAMPIAPLVGHEEVRESLASAVSKGRLPQVLLVTGPAGVGKQRLALWLGQLLLCRGAEPRPCGRCSGCIEVLNLAHPDLHWFVPVPRPKAGEVDRQIDEVAESLEGIMAGRREAGAWTAPDRMAIHGIASARLLQRQAALTPVEGGWRVFIIGDAERLVPQESSPDAANALLKLLEEPPARTLIVLTTSEPGLMLPTIRSRATPLRLARLSDADVADYLRHSKPELLNDATVKAAHGSIGRLVGGPQASGADSRADARELLDLARDHGPAGVARVLRQGPWQARGEFTVLLDALAQELADRARRAATTGGHVSSRDEGAVGHVLEARDAAQGNANPQLLLAVLLDELRSSEAP